MNIKFLSVVSVEIVNKIKMRQRSRGSLGYQNGDDADVIILESVTKFSGFHLSHVKTVAAFVGRLPK